MDDPIIIAVRRWVEDVVVGLDLCPFAKRELTKGTIRFRVSRATDANVLLLDLQDELETLSGDPTIETTLLILPDVLEDFYDFNGFFRRSDGLLKKLDLRGVFQVASFHPHYQFASTAPEDPENYTNRSPYPILHVLREDSVSRAVDAHPDPEGIPLRNIERLRGLGRMRLEALLAACSENIAQARERDQ